MNGGKKVLLINQPVIAGFVNKNINGKLKEKTEITGKPKKKDSSKRPPGNTNTNKNKKRGRALLTSPKEQQGPLTKHLHKDHTMEPNSETAGASSGTGTPIVLNSELTELKT